VLPLENGHTTLSSLGPSDPQYEEEKSLLDFISKKVYEGKHNIEWEDICSGRGIKYCYEWAVGHSTQPLTPAEIVRQALADPPEPKAAKALFLHYKYLFRTAQQQSIGLQAKGVFLCGDNQVSNDPFVSSHALEYKEEFLCSTKSSWLTDVPIYRQIKLYNLNLLGCLVVAQRIS